MSAGAPSDSEPPGTRSMRAGLTDSSSIEPRDADHAGMDEPIEAQRHGGLEPGDAERRMIELDVLLVVVVRRVVGGDDVDAAVGNALEHRIAVGGLAQRRVHLDVGVVRAPARRASRR